MKKTLIFLLFMAISSTLPFLVSAAEGDMTIYNLGAGPGIAGVNYPVAAAFDGTNLWVVTQQDSDKNALKVSLNGLILQRYPVPSTGVASFPMDIAFDGTNMWIPIWCWGTYGTSGALVKMDPTGNTTTYTFADHQPYSIAFDGTNMWTAAYASVGKISPTGTITRHPLPQYPTDIAFDGTNMWTANYNGGVTKISSTGSMVSYPTGYSEGAIAFDGTNMWATGHNNTTGAGVVSKISSSGGVTNYAVPGGPAIGKIAFDGTNMWVVYVGFDDGMGWGVSIPNDSVIRVSPAGSMQVYPGTGYSPMHIISDGAYGANLWTVAGGSRMWTADYLNNSITRIGTAPVLPCTLPWGGTITSGTSATTYQASSVVSPATCTSQVRTCTNGTLSGTYTNQACTVTAALAIPTVTTPTVSSITTTGATIGANVTSLGNPATITARGTCWGTTASPTTNCVAAAGVTTGIFTHTRTGLTASTLYYYRGYADNSTGRGYSVDGTFTTSIDTPTPPTISGPTTLITGHSGTYSFVSTDPQGEQISYAVDWNSDGTDLWMPYGSVPLPGAMTYVNSGVSQSASKSWATPGTYTVRVLAQDTMGNNSAWTTYTITVSDPQPCTAGVVDSVGSWAPTCATSATCTTPPDPAQLTNQPGIQIGICPTPEYTGTTYRACSTAAITCTPSTFCGDSTCNGSETILTCPADCKVKYQQF